MLLSVVDATDDDDDDDDDCDESIDAVPELTYRKTVVTTENK